MLLNIFPVVILTLFQYVNTAPVVVAYCTPDFIKLRLQFNYNYFGIIYTSNSRESCKVVGAGDFEITFSVPLKEPGRSRCGVVLHGKLHTVTVAVRNHHTVETTNDFGFLVQCPNSTKRRDKEIQNVPATIGLYYNDEGNQRAVARNVVVGQRYDLELKTSKKNVQISTCVAFSVGSDLRFQYLLDNDGCSLDESLLKSFRVSNEKGSFNGELTMFRFNGSHELHVQCELVECDGGNCKDLNCNKRRTDRNLSASEAKNEKFSRNAFALVSTRLIVQDYNIPPHNVAKLTKCYFSEEPHLVGMSVLLSLFVASFVVLMVTAFLNRPFRCQLHERDSASMEELGKSEKAPDTPTFSYKTDILRSIALQQDSKTLSRKSDSLIIRNVITAAIIKEKQKSISTNRINTPSSQQTQQHFENSTIGDTNANSQIVSNENVRVVEQPINVNKANSIKSSIRSLPIVLRNAGQLCRLPHKLVPKRNKSFLMAIIEKAMSPPKNESSDCFPYPPPSSDKSSTHEEAAVEVEKRRSPAALSNKSNVNEEAANVYETPDNKVIIL